MAKICYLLTSCMVQVLLAKHKVKNNVNSWVTRRVQHIRQQRGSAVKQILLLKTVNKVRRGKVCYSYKACLKVPTLHTVVRTDIYSIKLIFTPVFLRINIKLEIKSILGLLQI